MKINNVNIYPKFRLEKWVEVRFFLGVFFKVTYLNVSF